MTDRIEALEAEQKERLKVHPHANGEPCRCEELAEAALTEALEGWRGRCIDVSFLQGVEAGLREKLAEQERLRERAMKAVRFFASVIKAGEPWTNACEQAYQDALPTADLNNESTPGPFANTTRPPRDKETTVFPQRNESEGT